MRVAHLGEPPIRRHHEPGVPLRLGRGALRLSVGRFTTEEEIDRAAELLSAAVR